MSRLFAWRGVVLGAVGVLVALSAEPTARSLGLALPWLLVGLVMRAWAFRSLGPMGRTRDPAPPAGRVEAGPYRWLRHPVYVGNVCIAVGIIASAALPATLAMGVLLFVVLLYTLLAGRETAQLRDLPVREPAGLGAAALLRSERSTFLSVGALLLLQLFVAVTR